MQELQFYFLLERVYRKMRHKLQATLKKQNVSLTLDQWMVLEQIARNEGISQISLADSLNKEPPSVTRMVDLLIDNKLIRREMNREDRRKHHLVMEEKGKELVEELSPHILERLAKGLETLPTQEQKKLAELLEKLSREFSS